MIRVTLEMVSARGPAHDRLLGIAHIANSGPSPAGTLYACWLSKTIDGRTAEKWKDGRLALTADQAWLVDADATEIPDFDNVRRGAWDLLYLALKAVVGRRNV